MSMTMSRCYSIIYWMVCQSLKAGNKSNYLCFKPVPQNQTRDENSLLRFLRKGSYKKLIRYEGIRSWKRKTLSKDGIWSVVLERVGFRGGSVVKNPPTNAGDAGWWARGDLGVLSRSHQRTGCQQGNRIPEVHPLKSEGLHYLNDCLRKCDCGMGRAGRILGPT